MTFQEFSRANKQRQLEAFAPGHSPMGAVLCVVEEVGEIAAVVLGIEGEKKRKAHLNVEHLANEIADAVTYLDILASQFGIDLHDALVEKFNFVSDRVGSAIKVSTSESGRIAELERKNPKELDWNGHSCYPRDGNDL